MIDRVDMARPPASAAGSAAKAWQRALEMTGPIGCDPTLTLPVAIDEVAERFPTSPALLSETETLSYRDLAALSRRYAGWALRHGVGKGDVVALMMPNCPQYFAIWLGIARVGGVAALVNTNLVDASLLHSLETVAPKHIIAGAALLDAIAAIRPGQSDGMRVWAYGGDGHGFPRIEDALGDSELDDRAFAPAKLDDRALYIYTSGTTGLPKAAAVSHQRLMQWTHWFAGMMDIAPSDRMYCCLPMYHSIGGVVAIGAPLVAGASVFIRERFSASRFWDDVSEHGCTLFQYIGELCRYLVAAPPHPRERANCLRLACGNGLRRDVWEAFQSRFAIPQILEFYAATEGSFSLYNAEGKPGAIGRIPPFLSHRFPVALVKFDVGAGAPARGSDGFCVRCAPDEPGEAIGKIADGGAGRFEGYTDAEASAKKVFRNVFAEGDSWYRTGDLMRRDRAGYFYFVDRIGDTFRWKGENVSTGEVEEVIAACPGVAEVVVYGVAVPGAEGRAGMAAIVPGEGFDLAQLRRHLADRLPDYARPLFLRLRDGIALTGTFKPQKQQLAADGYDPAATDDALYCDDRMQGAYIRLDTKLHRDIQAGKIRL